MYRADLNLIMLQGLIEPTAFDQRDLQIKEDKGQAFPASARAIVFIADDLRVDASRQKLVQWVRRRAKNAADCGLGCLIATLPNQENLAAQTIVNTRGNKPKIVLADPQIVAQECLRMEPGPLPNFDLSVKGGDDLDAETVLLLKRAFSDFDKIVLDPLPGGRSAINGIWRVDAQSRDTELRSPFVAKCGPVTAITKQLDTYRDVVADRVPYRGCAPICLERSVAGSSKRLSVSRFVERAKRLDDLLKHKDCPNVSDLMARIYSGPLHRWRATVEHQTVELVPQFLPQNVRERYKNGLSATYRQLKAMDESVTAPDDLFLRLEAVVIENAPLCRAHDDLNFRNIFVGEGGMEIILIDFTRAVKRPLSQDVARLDVGLAFDDDLNEDQPIDNKILQDYFTDDLFSISLRHAVNGQNARARLQAIAALRHNILVEADQFNYDPRIEYKVAVISGLLYEAKRQTPWSAIAYTCADKLSLTL